MKRIKIFGFVIFVFYFFSCPINPALATDIRDSVVKIYTTTNRVDFYHPWQTKGSTALIGSGCILNGNRILTNAHVVSDQTFIQVKKYSDPKKYTAKIVAIGHDCDLAVLEVEDENFFKDVPALDIGELPSLRDVVNVIGFPTGGDEISITEGVVSRIEVTRYVHSFARLLTVQIDAAVNPGNSGGPVVKDGKLIGVAMQVAPYAQNIGYIIPTPVINHFLADLKDGQYAGFPLVGFEFLRTENPTLREFYKIKDKKGGILISRVLPYSSSSGKLQEGDVILEIDGVPVAEDGTFQFRNIERLLATHLISQKQIGEKLSFKIIRDGKEQELTFSLLPFNPFVPNPYSARNPPYYIYGGFVFTVLSADLLMEWNDQGNDAQFRAPIDFSYFYFGSGRLNEEQKKEVVVLLNVLPDAINVGYHDYFSLIVTKVNGKDIDSFKDFVLTLNKQKSQEPYTNIETREKVQIILKNEDIDSTDKEILKRNSIPRPYSEEVAQWLQDSSSKQDPKTLAERIESEASPAVQKEKIK